MPRRRAARTRTSRVMITLTMITDTATTTTTTRIPTTLAAVIQTTSTTMGIANDLQADRLELLVTTVRR